MLERTYPERWRALCKEKISDYDATYRMLYHTELKPAGLMEDIEAERTIGARALESAEERLLDSLRALADDMSGRYLEARWL